MEKHTLEVGVVAQLRYALCKFPPFFWGFIGSLLLSLIALQKGTINRDGMFYIETARLFLERDLAATVAFNSWPFLSILMALISQITGLGLESSGHLLNALFMAGASALLVSCAARLHAESNWYVCLAILALPGFNGYRDELLREYGAWFFTMLSFWLAIRWAELPRWSMVSVIQLCLFVAALFRPEMLALLVALFLWQMAYGPVNERLRRLLMMGCVPLLGIAMLIFLQVNGHLASTRLAGDFTRFSMERFDAKALAVSTAFIDYARDQAHIILFFGSLSIIPVKFIGKMGVFIVPLFYALGRYKAMDTFKYSQVFAWAFLVHSLVLAVFVLDMQFISGRYIGPLVLFAAPLTGYGIWLLVQRHPRWKYQIIFIVLAMMISNVVSFGPGKYHFVKAGEWLAKNAEDTPRVYIESARSAYYAGWRYSLRPLPKNRNTLIEALSKNQYDLVVLEMPRVEPDLDEWLRSAGLSEIIRFVNADQAAVIIAKRMSSVPQDVQ